MHKLEYYARFSHIVAGQTHIAPMTIPTSAAKVLELDRRIASDGSKGPLLVVAPGASPVETHKLWSHGKYAALVRAVLERYADARVVLFGGRSESHQLNGIARGLGSRVTVFAQDDLELSLTLLRKAACLVCGCSGAAHMATLVGAPTIAIYGPTNPSITGPRQANVRIIRKNYQCSPCYRPGFEAGCGDPVCISDISVEEVLAALIDTLDGKPFPPIPACHTTTATQSNKTVRLPVSPLPADALAI
jgi:ADP-heptose:LPS heptosyltransferase